MKGRKVDAMKAHDSLAHIFAVEDFNLHDTDSAFQSKLSFDSIFTFSLVNFYINYECVFTFFFFRFY